MKLDVDLSVLFDAVKQMSEETNKIALELEKQYNSIRMNRGESECTEYDNEKSIENKEN